MYPGTKQLVVGNPNANIVTFDLDREGCKRHTHTSIHLYLVLFGLTYNIISKYIHPIPTI